MTLAGARGAAANHRATNDAEQSRSANAAAPLRNIGRPVGSRRSCFPNFTALRVARGLSCADVASRLTALGEPTNERSVNAWERRGTRPTEERIDLLAKIFRVRQETIEKAFGLEFGASHRG